MEATIEAVFADTLVLHYRTQADVLSGAVAGFDLHGISSGLDRLPVDYATFVQAIERDDRAVRLVDNVLHALCADIGMLAAQGTRMLPFTVRLPHAVLVDAQLPARLARLLAHHGLPPHSLCIGVKESSASAHDVHPVLVRLKEDGIPLVLLDFDVDTAPLALLGCGRFHAVQPGLRTCADDSKFGGALLVALTGVAHAAAMRVIAGHVDNAERFALARSAECDLVQGDVAGPQITSAGLLDHIRAVQDLPQPAAQRQTPRNLLLVDDEANILSALKRLLRRDNYTIHTAASGQEGLEILASHPIDVIVSDQRMPGMTGVEFLRQCKSRCPETTRIVLSGYSELQSVMAAVNEGAIYKFLMKPWDDGQLREHIAEAFRRKEMEDENRRLDLKLKALNNELSATNLRLQEVLLQQEQRITTDETSLHVAREALDLMPVPVLALDDENVIAYLNGAAMELFVEGAGLLGSDAADTLPELLAAVQGIEGQANGQIAVGARNLLVVARHMGGASRSRGRIVALL